MSFKYHRIAQKARGLSAPAKAVILALACYADPKGRAFPSQATLAFDTGLCERTVRTALASLESLGWIVRERRNKRDGSRSSDLITIQDADARAAYVARVRRLPLVALMVNPSPPPVEAVDNLSDNMGDKSSLPATDAAWPTGNRCRVTAK